nr:MAG TPA: hypothetical protein [Bacteriophage sp.]
MFYPYTIKISVHHFYTILPLKYIEIRGFLWRKCFTFVI